MFTVYMKGNFCSSAKACVFSCLITPDRLPSTPYRVLLVVTCLRLLFPCACVREAGLLQKDVLRLRRSLYNTAIIGRVLLTWFPNAPAFISTPLACAPCSWLPQAAAPSNNPVTDCCSGV